MLKKYIHIIKISFVIINIFVINTFTFGNLNNDIVDNSLVENHSFLSVGGLKTVRNTPFSIKRLDLTIEIDENYDVKIKNNYELKNMSKYNVKSTFMFPIDINVEGNVGSKQTNIKNEYIKNIKFITDYKYNKHLRAVINFDEKIYQNQSYLNIQRDWYAVSNTIKANDTENIIYKYTLTNSGIKNTNLFIYSYDLTTNFTNNNIADIFIVTIINKSDKSIKDIVFSDYSFNKIKSNRNREIYRLAFADVELKDKIYIYFN